MALIPTVAARLIPRPSTPSSFDHLQHFSTRALFPAFAAPIISQIVNTEILGMVKDMQNNHKLEIRIRESSYDYGS